MVGDDDEMDADLAAGGTLLNTEYMDNCDQFKLAASLTSTLSPTVSYSCLLVDPDPITAEWTVGETSRATPIRDANSGPVGSVTVAWQAADDNTDLSNCTTTTFEPEANRACKTPILRVDLVRTDTANRNALNSNSATTFLLPVTSGGSTTIPFAPSTIAAKSSVNCSASTTPKICKVTFTGMGGIGYYIRMKSVYGSSSVTVSASATNSENPKLELKDSQIVVDATGKAADVLRRIQVRIPFIGATNVPDFAIQSGDTICKQLQVAGATASPANADPACQP